MIFDQAWLTAAQDCKNLLTELGQAAPHVPPPYRSIIKQAIAAVRLRFEGNLLGGQPVDEDLINLKQLVNLVDILTEDSWKQRLAESCVNAQATTVNTAVPAEV